MAVESRAAPQSWPDLVIGDYLEAVIDYRGKTPPKSPTGIPTLTAANVKNGRIDLSSVSYVSPETYERFTTRGFPKPNDVLITTEAPVGEVAPFPGDKTYLITRRVIALRGKGNELDNQYLLYALMSPRAQNHLAARERGSTVPRVLKPDILGMRLPIPSINEQRAIARILGTLDDKIELNRRMNETLEGIARALFKSWFVDFDPVRAKAEGRETGLPSHIADLFPDRLEPSELGEIPAGWKVCDVADIGKVICGKTPSTSVPEYYDGDVPFITIPDIRGKVFITTTGKYLSSGGAASQRKKSLPAGSICVSCIATPGLVAITSEKSQTNQQVNSVVPNVSSETYYWYQALTDLGEEIRAAGSGGSVLSNLSTSRFSILRLLAPTTEIRSAYQAVVAPLFAGVLANDHSSLTLAATRDALLPKLISGELRVKDAERFAEEATS